MGDGIFCCRVHCLHGREFFSAVVSETLPVFLNGLETVAPDMYEPGEDVGMRLFLDLWPCVSVGLGVLFCVEFSECTNLGWGFSCGVW